jgi:hypothetical protein
MNGIAVVAVWAFDFDQLIAVVINIFRVNRRHKI